VPESAAAPSRRARTFAIGAISYRAADLERAVAASQRLEILVVGVCTFADDVTPELVARAIGRVRVRGAVIASAPVRAALEALEALEARDARERPERVELAELAEREEAEPAAPSDEA